MANSVGSLGLGWRALTGLSGTVLALLAWRARQHAALFRSDQATPAEWMRPHDDAPLMTFESRELDVEQEVASVFASLQEMARHHQVELQASVQPRLTVWADPCALRQMLAGMAARAIERTEGGGVLVSATWHGGRVQVGVSDDGPATDPAILMGALRQVEQCAALQGGTLEIACDKPRGVRVVLRLPGPSMRDPLGTEEDDGPGQPTAHGAPWTCGANVS